MGASNREQLVQQDARLQLAADHSNSEDFDALGECSLVTAAGGDRNEGKKLCVEIIFDPGDISTVSFSFCWVWR